MFERSYRSIFNAYVTSKESNIVDLAEYLLLDRHDRIFLVREKHNSGLNYVEIASKYDLLAIPVVDNNEVLIGVVNTHDLIDEVLYPMWKKKNK